MIDRLLDSPDAPLEQGYLSYKWVANAGEVWESNWVAKTQHRNSNIAIPTWGPNFNSHYDLQPDNILYRPGSFIVSDFGLSRLSDDDLSGSVQTVPKSDAEARHGAIVLGTGLWSRRTNAGRALGQGWIPLIPKH